MTKLSSVFQLICLGSSLVVPGLASGYSDQVRVDQVGYLPQGVKLAMVVPGAASGPFTLRRVSDNAVVLRGLLGPLALDQDSGDALRTADFSALTVTGAYLLDVEGVGRSCPFDIGPAVYMNAYQLALRAFYGQRCGTAVDLGVVDGVRYRHALCHSSGASSDLPATMHASSGQAGARMTGKGWHDAGAYGKYVVNSGISTGELLWAYEWWQDRAGAVAGGLPESGNGTPDLLNEARWNLEWMLTMQDQDGGAWHKVTSARFGGFVLPEDDDAGTRYVIGPGATPGKASCATADLAAVAAIGARLYRPYDTAFADACLKAAQKAWAWVMVHPAVAYDQPAGIRTGGYTDASAADEMLWAAAELYHSTGSAEYGDYVVAHAGPSPLLPLAGPPPSWANVKDLGLWAYYFCGRPGADAALRARILDDTVATADATAARTNAPANGYKVSLSSDQYQWGSNGAVANYGVLLLVADRMSPHPAYTNAALNDLHYLLGCNTHATCFVTHLGSRPVLHPHHRPSASPQYAAGPPWPGMLSGGPNSRSDDGSALDAIPSSPPAKRWVDLKASYASNEIAINWQAPLVFLLAWTLPVPMAARPGPDQP
jgi:endoglucanase